MQLNLFHSAGFSEQEITRFEYLKSQGFDCRRKSYESDANYRHRITTIFDASKIVFDDSIWSSVAYWADICPRNENDRLPKDKSKVAPHTCYYLEIKSISPEHWLPPLSLLPNQANDLPKRATFRATKNDILLSRFKEPLGKCVIYTGELNPLYVSSNYLLLRHRNHVNSHLLLGLLRSSFIAWQLHLLIQQRSVIAEMYHKDAYNLKVPNLSIGSQKSITTLVQQRISLEKKYLSTWANISEEKYAVDTINEVERKIDATIAQEVNPK